MSEPFIRKLEHAGILSEEERGALQAVTTARRIVSIRHDIVTGTGTDRVYLITSGIAGRYKMLQNGTRRIVSFVLPGDLCWAHASSISPSRDLRVVALTPCSICDILQPQLTELIRVHPGVSRAMWWFTLAELSRTREWVVNDSRPAPERLAHLLCELLVSLQAVGLAEADSFELKLSQVDLADALGVSQVHINRVVQTLRTKDLIVWCNQRIRIPSVQRLKAFGEFDPGYLCLSGLDLQ